MSLPQLENLVRIRQLKAEPGTQSEVDGLFRSGHARLKDARLKELSLDSRFDLAYNAAHAFALAALRWHGYRSENRYTVFQCLEQTVKLPSELWRAYYSKTRIGKRRRYLVGSTHAVEAANLSSAPRSEYGLLA